VVVDEQRAAFRSIEEVTVNGVFVVLTNPVEGREAEYNDWYSGTHLAEVVALDGFKSAQRFALADPLRMRDAPYRFLALYEAEDGRSEVAAKSLATATKEGRIVVSDALAPDPSARWFTPITDVLGRQAGR
jgi:hypothetical protein